MAQFKEGNSELSKEASGSFLFSIVQNNTFSNLLPAQILLGKGQFWKSVAEVEFKNLVSGSNFLQKKAFLFAFGLDIFPIKFHCLREKCDLKALLKTRNKTIWIGNHWNVL